MSPAIEAVSANGLEKDSATVLYISCSTGGLLSIFKGVGAAKQRTMSAPRPSRDGIHQYFYNFSIFFLSFF
jgi:hypothetical protein